MNKGQIAGVDGCGKAGWLVASSDSNLSAVAFAVVPGLQQIIEAGYDVVAIDIPIGVPDRGTRSCDLLSRKLVGPRRSSVFPCPIRPSLGASNRLAADAAGRLADGRGMGPQAWAIVPKIREADRLMSPELQERVIEVHPELCFHALNGGQPLMHSKHQSIGLQYRRDLLLQAGFAPSVVDTPPPRGAAIDDLYDALAALWTAHRRVHGSAGRVPEVPELDPRGLRMEMWF